MIETSISIRSATVEDAERIHALHMAAVRVLCAPHYAPEIVEAWLANRSAQGYLRGIGAGATIVAELASNVVGFGEGVPGEIVAVFVDPDFASRGIGSALLKHTLRLAHEHRGPVRLESTLNAVGFYERFGFSQVERSVVRRNQIEIPIVIMQRRAG
jgi:GNAT superfamily N-acetyltransferase